MIVGRNPETLDEAALCRAAIESLAENFSDGIVAPAVWLGAGGLAGGALYKAINTADSMIGHRTPRHEAFGWAAARLDDLVNLPASRLTAGLVVAAAALTPGASARGRSTPSGAMPDATTARPMPAGPKPRWPAHSACGSPARGSTAPPGRGCLDGVGPGGGDECRHRPGAGAVPAGLRVAVGAGGGARRYRAGV